MYNDVSFHQLLTILLVFGVGYLFYKVLFSFFKDIFKK